jgi:hypothetical protein
MAPSIATLHNVGMIHEALRKRGYKRLAIHKADAQTMVDSFRVYSNDKTTLIWQVFRGGGVEVFAPVCTENNVYQTIDTIP